MGNFFLLQNSESQLGGRGGGQPSWSNANLKKKKKNTSIIEKNNYITLQVGDMQIKLVKTQPIDA